MLDTLKGGTLWAVVLVILAVIGAATYLASQGTLSGSDVLTLLTLILGGAVGITSAHVAGNTAITAVNTPVPGSASPPTVTPAPVPVAAPNPPAPNAAVPAMPPAVT